MTESTGGGYARQEIRFGADRSITWGTVTHAALCYPVRRTWREHLLSWPWRPWATTKTRIVMLKLTDTFTAPKSGA